MNETPEIDVHEASARVEKGAFLLDVREQSEFDTVRIPGGRLLPLSEFTSRFAEEVPKERDIVVYCRSGRRSAQAVDYLIAQGYDAVNVGGGILAWQGENLPTEPEGAVAE